MKKKMLGFIFTICLIFSSIVVLSACDEHEHTFSETLTIDDNQHWYECECGEKKDVADHSSETWSVDENQHWHECECGTKLDVANHSSSTWTVNENQHWHECICGVKSDITDHNYSYNGVCLTCDYDSESIHVDTVEELNSAIASGGLIKLDADIALGDFTGDKLVIANGITVSLDLNGKTISGRNSDETVSSALFANNGTLIINDSSTNKTGKIYMTDTGVRAYTWAHGIFTIKNAGTLTINGGTIENAGTTDVPYAIDNISTDSKDAVLTLNGGNIVSYCAGIRLYANSTTKENKVVIESGTVTGGTSGIWVQQPNGNANKAELIVNGGTIYGKKYNGIYLSINNNENGGAVSLKVTGGIIKNNSATEGSVSLNDRAEQSLENSTVNVLITGGTFYNENVGPAFACLYGTLNTTNVTISGGIFSTDPTNVVPNATGYTISTTATN